MHSENTVRSITKLDQIELSGFSKKATVAGVPSMIFCSNLSEYSPASARINNCAAKTVLIRGVPSMARPIFSIKGTSPLTPNPDPERKGSAYAVIVNDQAYLIDFGPGVVRSAAALSPEWGGNISALSVKNLEYAFLTHIHSDHSSGLADLLLTPWIMGRDKEIKLFGPSGLDKMANSILTAYEDDIDYRIYGTQPSNKRGYKYKFQSISEGLIYEDENVTVEAFKVPHGSFDDAYGFRFTTQDKVIVFSGDTGPSKTIEKLAYKADILIHEVYSQAGFLEKTML